MIFATPEDLEAKDAFFATPLERRTARMFTEAVLNCPPIESLVKSEIVPGRKGEQRHVPIEYLYQTADDIFEGLWSVHNIRLHTFQGKNGTRIACTVEVHCTLPIHGHPVRIAAGASDGSPDQTTASEAVIAFAVKNAFRRMGAIFGRDLYSEKYFANEAEIASTRKGFGV